MIEIKLKDLLKERERSLYWLQKESGVTYPTLMNLNKGEGKGVTFDVLDKLCNALACAPNDLIVHYPGKFYTLAEMAKAVGLSESALENGIRNGHYQGASLVTSQGSFWSQTDFDFNRAKVGK